MKRVRLTSTKIRTLAPGIHRDDKVRGLFVDVSRTSASYKIQGTLYGHGRPVSIRITLGRTTDVDLDQAREWAEKNLSKIRMGIDPRYDVADRMWTVREMYDRFAGSREKQNKDKVHTANILANRDRHLSHWLDRPLNTVTGELVEARHREIGRASGPSAANHTFKEFRSAWNHARKVMRRPDLLNPADAITWFVPTPPVSEAEAIREKALLDSELPDWWRAIQNLKNPLRRAMHILALLSGMRYGHLTEIKREWIHIDEKRIWFPKLKRGKAFDLPLSAFMVEIVVQALSTGEQIHPGSAWLFPTVALRGSALYRYSKGDIVPVYDYREKGIRTGHCMRHTYISFAAQLPIADHHRRMLVDHAIPGPHGEYLSRRVNFPELLAAQELITQHLLGICRHAS